MAHLHKKIKKGKAYYYIREMARVDGKPKVINQVYLGSVEKILSLALAKERPAGVDRIQTQQFGSLWLAQQVEKELGIVSLIDQVVPKGTKETGPTIGQYFLLAAINRMIEPRSKLALPEWFDKTAVRHLFHVDPESLDSRKFWRKWDRVSEKEIKCISSKLFEKIAKYEKEPSDCFLFDTTNYYTYLASKTSSELAARGKSKEGRNWLRQIGFALLVSKNNRLPLFYREYEGNCHDSKVFARVLDDMVAAMHSAGSPDKVLTVVFDKGMNSEDNMAALDARENVRFITTYSTYFAEDLIHKSLKEFSVVDIPRNKEFQAKGREDDQMLALRTTGTFWGKERVVIVTYSPRTATNQRYQLEKKLLTLRAFLQEMKPKVSSKAPQWRKKSKIIERYEKRCRELHLPKELYDVSVSELPAGLKMTFRKNSYQISRYLERLGKNIIITSHLDWDTADIVSAKLDQYKVEEAFRQTKNHEHCSMRPVWHWTDSKIRCHILTCVIALCFLRIIEMKLMQNKVNISGNKAIDKMKHLNSCLCWGEMQKKPVRLLEEPTPEQARILRVFGRQITSGVLQKYAV